jgi:hypothetical protein
VFEALPVLFRAGCGHLKTYLDPDFKVSKEHVKRSTVEASKWGNNFCLTYGRRVGRRLPLKSQRRIERRFILTNYFSASYHYNEVCPFFISNLLQHGRQLTRLRLSENLYNQRSTKVCNFVCFTVLFDLFSMRAGGSYFVCLTFYWEASLLHAIIKVKQFEADAEAVAAKAAKKIADDIVLKICNDLYDKVMQGQ